MISVLLYGRNDDYGYNLHKRAAISFNCIAEVLQGTGDEILFVDYNTPDDRPTFPEAIADTLTVKAKRLIRVLRVRPALHARFASRTHLLALEPVARNIALRRSSKENPWVLSTNTDMIFLPRGYRSLNACVEDLGRGFYHTPRFELPESLWEGLQRGNPVEAMAEVAATAKLLHLNEVIHASPVVLFDGPGDFQLARRTDLFSVDGFDERMLSGWHVDSNLAKRLDLAGVPVRGLADRVFAYHCDHTRQATAPHESSRLGNDEALYVDGVTEATLPEQRDRWGCPHEAIEELELRTGSRYVPVLRAVLPRPKAETTEAGYREDTYGSYAYHAAHVLPFLLDLVTSRPPAMRLGWCGGRRDMLELFAAAWQQLGRTAPVLIDAGTAARIGSPPVPGTVATASWLDDADVAVFEFGLPSHSGREVPWTDLAALSPTDAEAVFCTAALLEAAALRQDPAAAAPQLIVGINVIHNPAAEIFSHLVRSTLTPFSTRLRHGYARRPAPSPAVDAAPDTGAAKPLTRTADRGDWDDPAWFSHLGAILPGARASTVVRSAGYWEQVHCLYALQQCGLLDPSREVLVASTLPERLVAALSARVGRVVVADLAVPPRPADDLYRFADRSLMRPAAIQIVPGASIAEFAQASFDAVIFPHGAMFSAGLAALPMRIGAALRALKEGGVLIFKAEIAAGSAPHDRFFSAGHLGPDGELIAALLEGSGLELAGGRATLTDPGLVDGIAEQDTALVWHEQGRRIVGSLWVLRKVSEPAADGVQRLAAVLASRSGGLNSLRDYLAGEAGIQQVGGAIGTHATKRGCIFFGPYLSLDPGHYRVEVDLRVASARVGARLSFDVMDGERRLMVIKADNQTGDRTIMFAFEVPSGGAHRLEVRAHTGGGVVASVLDCRITSVSALELDRSRPPWRWRSLLGRSRRDQLRAR